MLTATLSQSERESIINLVKHERKYSAICFPHTLDSVYDLVDHAMVRCRKHGTWGRLPRRLRVEIYSMFSY